MNTEQMIQVVADLGARLAEVERRLGAVSAYDNVPVSLKLTRQELMLVDMLVKAAPRVVERDFFVDSMRSGGYAMFDDSALPVLVWRARSKLAPHKIGIIAVRSVGFFMTANDAEKLKMMARAEL